MGRGRSRRSGTQARLAEEDGSDSDTCRIVERILAKLGPDLRQNREARRRPPMPGSQLVHGAEQEMTKSRSGDKSKESTHWTLTLHGWELIQKPRRVTSVLQVMVTS